MWATLFSSGFRLALLPTANEWAIIRTVFSGLWKESLFIRFVMIVPSPVVDIVQERGEGGYNTGAMIVIKKSIWYFMFV